MILDIMERTLEHNGTVVNLSCQKAAVLKTLAHAYPQFTRSPDLWGELWPSNSLVMADIALPSIMYSLRKSLDPVGLSVLSQYAKGYRLGRRVWVREGRWK